MKQTNPLLIVALAVLMAVGAFCGGCRTDGTLDPVALGVELEEAGAVAADLAVVYQDEEPDQAEDLLKLAGWLEVAGEALQTSEGAEARSALDAALALADELLKGSDDPDVQAGLIVVKAAVRRVQREL